MLQISYEDNQLLNGIQRELLMPLQHAVCHGDVELVRGVLEFSPILIHGWVGGSICENADPLIVSAVQGGHIEMMKFLMDEFAADPNEVGDWTALHWAIDHPNWKEIMDLLAEHGLDFNVSSEPSHNAFVSLALHWETKYGNDPIAIARYLAEKGADIRCGKPLLSLGPEHGAEFVKTMIELGAEVNPVSSSGKTPLDYLLHYQAHPEGWTNPGQYYAESTANARAMAEELRRHGGKRGSEL